MTREETSKIISLIRESYPQLYNGYSQRDLPLLVELWNAQFKCEDYRTVYKASMYYISTNPFPPTIASLKNVIYEMTDEHKLPSSEQAWQMMVRSGRNNRDNAAEEYNKLPGYLRDIATVETIYQIGNASKENLVFMKNDFLKCYQAVQESHRRAFQISSLSNDIKSIDSKEEALGIELNPSHEDQEPEVFKSISV